MILAADLYILLTARAPGVGGAGGAALRLVRRRPQAEDELPPDGLGLALTHRTVITTYSTLGRELARLLSTCTRRVV